MSDRTELTIRVERDQPIPKCGDIVPCSGFAGTYDVVIHRLIGARAHEDGALLFTVEATRTLTKKAGGECDH